MGKPAWQPYDMAKRTTKIFDMPCTIVNSQMQSSDNLLYDFWMNP
jgi:hypothetical protein